MRTIVYAQSVDYSGCTMRREGLAIELQVSAGDVGGIAGTRQQSEVVRQPRREEAE
jgi:hypothetical protein